MDLQPSGVNSNTVLLSPKRWQELLNSCNSNVGRVRHIISPHSSVPAKLYTGDLSKKVEVDLCLHGDLLAACLRDACPVRSDKG